MTLPVFAGVRVLGVDEYVWHHQDRRRRGPVSSPASWTTRGEDHPTALDPFQGQKERHRRSTPRRHQRPRCLHIVKLAGDAPGEVRRRVQQDMTGHRGRKGDPLYPGPQSFARLAHAGSPHVKRNASVRPSRQMRRISVSTSPTFTGQVREVFHQAAPAQGQRLAARLIQRLPACSIPEIARLGADPTQVEGRT